MKQELEQSLSMLWEIVCRRLEAEGIEQTTKALWLDDQGVPTDCIDKVKSVCVLGALNYAVDRKWITQYQGIAIQLALDCAASEREFGDIAGANKYVSFAEMKCWLETLEAGSGK